MVISRNDRSNFSCSLKKNLCALQDAVPLREQKPSGIVINNRISILLIGRRPIFENHPKSRGFFGIKSFFSL